MTQAIYPVTSAESVVVVIPKQRKLYLARFENKETGETVLVPEHKPSIPAMKAVRPSAPPAAKTVRPGRKGR